MSGGLWVGVQKKKGHTFPCITMGTHGYVSKPGAVACINVETCKRILSWQRKNVIQGRPSKLRPR